MTTRSDLFAMNLTLANARRRELLAEVEERLRQHAAEDDRRMVERTYLESEARKLREALGMARREEDQ